MTWASSRPARPGDLLVWFSGADPQLLEYALVDPIERVRAAVRRAAAGDDPFVLKDSTSRSRSA